MKIEHLRYFMTLADSSSISKAAEKLFISQQQLNRIITALEDEVQAKLVIRTTNGITLTEAGRDFLKYAQNIVTEYQTMKNHFIHRQQKPHPLLSTIHASCKVFLPPILSIYASAILRELKKVAPNIRLTIYEKTSVLNEGYFDLDALCFWAIDIAPEELFLPNKQPLCATPFGSSVTYLAYNRQFYPQGNISENDELLPIALSGTSSSSSYQETLQLYSSNLYQLLDHAMQDPAICPIPDFILPHVKLRYPEMTFTPTTIAVPLTLIHPECHTLTEADDIVIYFIKSYIQSKQLLAKQLL